MRMQHFGDSYDIVKKSLLYWLRTFGEWSVHPIFSETVSHADAVAFEKFLGATIISTEELTLTEDRSAYFSSALSCGNLFLDPDKGLCMSSKHKEPQKYLFASELIWLTKQRPTSLTIVFDQSVRRGSERPDMMKNSNNFLMNYINLPIFHMLVL